MKTLKSIISLILLSFIGFTSTAQNNYNEKLNLPGDNLNLYAVMDLFRDSETLEGFEKNLNAEDSKINNLDLNNDGKVDYIKVIDYVNGDDHTIVLQVAVTPTENQDVAVFTVQKDNSNQVQVQLVGDEELYGKNYIIEPIYDDASSASTPNPGYAGNSNNVQTQKVVVNRTTYVEVASWPVIRFMYVPTYVAWHSPWYWGYYPSYWSPWRPFYWDYYYGYHSHRYNYYYSYYRPWNTYRYAHWNDYYYKTRRSYSNTVYQHRQSGMYQNTYSRPDMRKQGSADYMKRNPAQRDGSKSRTTTNTDVNRQRSQPGFNKTTERRGTNTRDVRQNTNSPSNRQGVGNQGAKSRETKPAVRPNQNKSVERPAVNKRSERPANNKPAMRTENKRSQVKSESPRRSTESKRSVSKRSESKKPDRSGDNKSKRK